MQLYFVCAGVSPSEKDFIYIGIYVILMFYVIKFLNFVKGVFCLNFYNHIYIAN